MLGADYHGVDHVFHITGKTIPRPSVMMAAEVLWNKSLPSHRCVVGLRKT